MISENPGRSRRLFWLGYFEAVSQILPVLLLALAIEQRYLTRSQSTPEPPQLEFGEEDMHDLARWYGRAAKLYALIVLAALGLGEW
ncbi:MAG TPA: hypothetical protein VFS26_10275 [Solirubrobacterales bacterium]|nr:hypothetical protein [Solirubrobacterales bacterium]